MLSIVGRVTDRGSQARGACRTCDSGEPGAEPAAEPAADLAANSGAGCAPGYPPDNEGNPDDRADTGACENAGAWGNGGGCDCGNAGPAAWGYTCGCGCAEKGLLEGAPAEAGGLGRAAKGSTCACGQQLAMSTQPMTPARTDCRSVLHLPDSQVAKCK